MKFESFFRPKPKEELEKQVENIETENDIKLTHESIEEEAGLLDVAELKEKYKVRYDAYLEMLRAERRGEDLQESDFYKAKVLINALNNLDDYILAQERGEHRVLRGRQIPVFNEIRDALERGVEAGYIKLPTGVGKTVLFTQIIEAMNLKSLICVPSINLVNKTHEELETWTSKTYGKYTSEEKDTTKDVTVSTYQSLINAVRNGGIGNGDYPLIILDEAHKSLGDQTKATIDSLSGIKLGFTATPDYSQERTVRNLLPEEIYTMTLRESIEEGLICRTKTIHAHTDVDLSGVHITTGGDYDERDLEKVINIQGRNMAALELYKSKFSHLKAIVNCSGIKHSQDVAKLFQEKGIKAAHIDGNMSEDEQNEILKKLKKGEIRVVTNAKVLLEGFDEQSLSVALNLNPTLSFINAEQRGGRALRLEKGNPDKWAYVVDFIDKNPKKKQVLFSEILEGDIILPSRNDGREKNEHAAMEGEISEEIPINFEDLNIDGLKVVVNTKEILEVTKQYQESRKILERKEWTYETLREDVLAKGIKSASEYTKNSQINQWPAPPTLKKDPSFPKTPEGLLDWYTFLDQEKPIEWTYETLREDVLARGAKTSGEYSQLRKDNGWPEFKRLMKIKGFPKKSDGSPDWDTFFGREKRKEWTYESLREDVLSKGIQSTDVYKRKCKDYRWPVISFLIKDPMFPKKSDGSPDWDTFFRREARKKWTYITLRKDVLAKGVKSVSDYRKKDKDNEWPSYYALINMPEFPKYEDGSPDWDIFFGREKFDFEKFQKEVLEKSVKSSTDYTLKSKLYNWPATNTLAKMPEFPKNPDGSLDWDTFLAREKRKEWTYESLREDVLNKLVQSPYDYSRKAKENQWPAIQTVIKIPDFPKNSDGSPDWSTFLLIEVKEKRKEWTYETLRQDVIAKQVGSLQDYLQKAKENQWPSKQTLLANYEQFPRESDGSLDWDTFLGKEKRKQWTYETLREDLIKKGIKSYHRYVEVRKENQWPVRYTIEKDPKFPKKPDGTTDWKAFLDPTK